MRTLSKLHNLDKHQRLNLTAVVADSSNLRSNGTVDPFGLVSDIPLFDGGIFGNVGVPWDLPKEFASRGNIRTKDGHFVEKITNSLNQLKLQREVRLFALLMTLIALWNSFARSTR